MFKTTIKTYICPKCSELGLTCCNKGRQGFADSPGICSRHIDTVMEEKEIPIYCGICSFDNKICNDEGMCLRTGEPMPEQI